MSWRVDIKTQMVLTQDINNEHYYYYQNHNYSIETWNDNLSDLHLQIGWLDASDPIARKARGIGSAHKKTKYFRAGLH